MTSRSMDPGGLVNNNSSASRAGAKKWTLVVFLHWARVRPLEPRLEWEHDDLVRATFAGWLISRFEWRARPFGRAPSLRHSRSLRLKAARVVSFACFSCHSLAGNQASRPVVFRSIGIAASTECRCFALFGLFLFSSSHSTDIRNTRHTGERATELRGSPFVSPVLCLAAFCLLAGSARMEISRLSRPRNRRERETKPGADLVFWFAAEPTRPPSRLVPQASGSGTGAAGRVRVLHQHAPRVQMEFNCAESNRMIISR